jgi:pimeloyl-ACP methyl ester carboxylesterase
MARDFVLSGVFNLLCKDHRVIAFDRPGFGFSNRPRGRIWTPDAQASLFQEALWGLDVQRAVVVGNFLGDSRGCCPGATRSTKYRWAGIALWVLLSQRPRRCSADVMAGGAAAGRYSTVHHFRPFWVA